MELIKPQLQKVWKWPAATNFTTGGIGTGFYLIGMLLGLPRNEQWLTALLAGQDWFLVAFWSTCFKLLGPALVGIGFIALTSEAGRPLRGINLFRHLRRSWMSRETLGFALFVFFAGLDWLFPNIALKSLAAISALFLMFCQGMIAYAARGVTAWNSKLMPLVFMTSGFASGVGLLLPVAGFYGALDLRLIWIALGSVAANLVMWLVYIRTGDEPMQSATSALREIDSLAFTVGAGVVLPLLLFILVFLLPNNPSANAVAAGFAGLGMLVGNSAMKFGIVLKAGYLRAITLKVTKKVAYSQAATAAMLQQ